MTKRNELTIWCYLHGDIIQLKKRLRTMYNKTLLNEMYDEILDTEKYKEKFISFCNYYNQ